jgi:hypothetical protein
LPGIYFPAARLQPGSFVRKKQISAKIGLAEHAAKVWSIAVAPFKNPNVCSGYNLLAATRILFYCASETSTRW